VKAEYIILTNKHGLDIRILSPALKHYQCSDILVFDLRGNHVFIKTLLIPVQTCDITARKCEKVLRWVKAEYIILTNKHGLNIRILSLALKHYLSEQMVFLIHVHLLEILE